MAAVHSRGRFGCVETAIPAYIRESRSRVHRDMHRTAAAQNFFHIIDSDRQRNAFQLVALGVSLELLLARERAGTIIRP